MDRFASGCSLNEDWQVGDYFRRYDSDFQELDSVGAVEGDGFNNALVQKKQEAWFDQESHTFADRVIHGLELGQFLSFGFNFWLGWLLYKA